MWHKIDLRLGKKEALAYSPKDQAQHSRVEAEDQVLPPPKSVNEIVVGVLAADLQKEH
jgi:hypothetical protein